MISKHKLISSLPSPSLSLMAFSEELGVVNEAFSGFSLFIHFHHLVSSFWTFQFMDNQESFSCNNNKVMLICRSWN